MIERVEIGSNKLLLTKALDLLADLTEEEKLIFLNMNKGCAKRLKNIKDLLDFTYEYYVCQKQNDNEVIGNIIGF